LLLSTNHTSAWNRNYCNRFPPPLSAAKNVENNYEITFRHCRTMSSCVRGWTARSHDVSHSASCCASAFGRRASHARVGRPRPDAILRTDRRVFVVVMTLPIAILISFFLAQGRRRWWWWWREFNRKILRGKPTRCRVIPGRPALLAWWGGPAPRELLC